MSGENPDRMAQLPGAIRVAIPPIAPPRSLEARVLDAVAREAEEPAPQARRRFEWLRGRRLAPAFAGAAAVAAATIVAVLLLGGGGPQSVLEIEADLRAPGGPVAASVEVRKTGIGRVVTFRSETLPTLPKGDYYELWFVGLGDRPGRRNRISAGTFHPDEDGRSFVRLAAAVDPKLYPVLVVTAEPGDGDPRPTGPEVLRGEP